MTLPLQRRASDGALLRHASGALMGECCCEVDTCQPSGCASPQPERIWIYKLVDMVWVFLGTAIWQECWGYAGADPSDFVGNVYWVELGPEFPETPGIWEMVGAGTPGIEYGAQMINVEGCTPVGTYAGIFEDEGETFLITDSAL